MSPILPKTNRKESRSAFTIVELLVATAVTAVLAGLLLMMTSGVLNAWNKTSGTLSVNNQAKLIFDMLGEDLQGAIFRQNGENIWLAVDILPEGHPQLSQERGWTVSGSFSARIKPGGTISNDRESSRLGDSRYGLSGSWLRFFTTGSGTRPVAVSYQLARRHVTGDPSDTSNPAEVRYMLYRSIIAPGNVIQRGYDLNPSPPVPAPDSNDPPVGYWQAGNPLINPPRGQIIATNVIDFGVRLYVRDDVGQLMLYFPSANYTAPTEMRNQSGNNHRGYLADGGPKRVIANGPSFQSGTTFGPFPDTVDIFVRILTGEGARLIQNLEAGRIPDEGNFDKTWWQIAEANSHVFTQRIHINAKPF